MIQCDVGVESAKELKEKFTNIKISPKDTDQKEVYKIFSNFSIIKFHNNKINNFDKFSLSLDFPIYNNKKSIKKFINNIVSQNNLEVELSKDIALNKLNNLTLVKNDIFKQKNKIFN